MKMMQKFNLSWVNESIIIVTTSLKHQQFDFNGDLREWGTRHCLHLHIRSHPNIQFSSFLIFYYSDLYVHFHFNNNLI